MISTAKMRNGGLFNWGTFIREFMSYNIYYNKRSTYLTDKRNQIVYLK